MANNRKSGGYGEQPEPTGGGAYASTPKKDTYAKRPTATYGAPAAATGYYASDDRGYRRFPWWILAILCVLAVLLVIVLSKYGMKDTVPYTAPPKPVPTTVYTPPTTLVSYPLARTG